MTTDQLQVCTSGKSILPLSNPMSPMQNRPCGTVLHEMVVPGSDITALVCPKCDLLPFAGPDVSDILYPPF